MTDSQRLIVSVMYVLVVAITCPAPAAHGVGVEPLPSFGAENKLKYLESYTYSCMEGYTTTDDLCTVCQPDGTLSLTTAPNCTGELILLSLKLSNFSEI